MFCSMCGKKIREDSKFCPYCGATVGKQEELIAPEAENTIKNEQKESTQQTVKSEESKAEEYEQKKGFDSKWIAIPAAVVVVAAGAWIGLGKKTDSKPEQQETEYIAESESQETETERNNESTAEEESEIEVSFAEDAEEDSSDDTAPEEYILPECATRIYTKDELSALSADELRLARNEIYARHGRIFSAEDLKNYFQSKSWYTPQYEGTVIDEKGDSILNEYEIANRDLIVELENGKKENSESIEETWIEVSEIWIENGNCCIIRGNYVDLVDDGSDCEFHYDVVTKKANIIAMSDRSTNYEEEYIANMENFCNYVKCGLDAFGNSYVHVKKNGNYIIEVLSAGSHS